MIADRIEREIRIEAPIDVVWSIVTEPEQIPHWFADVVDVELVPGAEGTFTFRKYDTPATINVHIERLEPPHHFAFRWAYPDGAEPDATNAPLVEFTLTEEGDETTRLTLVESGLRGLEWDDGEKERYVAGHSRGWDTCVRLLEEYLQQAAAR